VAVAEVSKEVVFREVLAEVQVGILMHLHIQVEQELQVKEIMAVEDIEQTQIIMLAVAVVDQAQ
jgi:hypothetical protein